MKLISLVYLFLIVTLFNSCKNDLDALAPYKESIAVYGLIDPADSVNYIRVNKVFLGAGSAVDVAQIQDSVYFKPGEATVIVEKYWNGNLRQKYIFTETYEKPLQPGVFNTNQLIYKSTQKFKADSSIGNFSGNYFEYKLVVKNNKTGAVFSSKKINLIKEIKSNSTFQLCSSITNSNNCFFYDPNSIVFISAYQSVNGPSTTKIEFNTPKNCSFTSNNLVFYYRNVYLNNNVLNDEFKFDNGFNSTENNNGLELMNYSFYGVNFFNALNVHIKDEANIYYRIADSIKFNFYFAGQEYKLYREINNSSGAFGQEKPIYTNMENDAIGIFSCRTKFTVLKKMFDCSIGTTQSNIINQRFLEDLSNPNYPYCRMRFNSPGVSSSGNCTIKTGC